MLLDENLLQFSNRPSCTVVAPSTEIHHESLETTGRGFEQLLSLPPVQIWADLLPGMVKNALRAPVPVEALTGTCVAAAMGML